MARQDTSKRDIPETNMLRFYVYGCKESKETFARCLDHHQLGEGEGEGGSPCNEARFAASKVDPSSPPHEAGDCPERQCKFNLWVP